METKLQLHGFNNLTKSLSFNIYDICYAQTEEQREAYIDYIDEMYNAERLTQILTDVVKIIGANVLNPLLAVNTNEERLARCVAAEAHHAAQTKLLAEEAAQGRPFSSVEATREMRAKLISRVACRLERGEA